MSRLPTSVLLLPGVPSDNGPSMARYARELFSSLLELTESRYAFTLEQPVQRNYVSRVMDHPQARRIDNAWCRYVTYPRSLRGRKADVFHILDHGYAHLARSVGGRPVVVTCHDLIPLLAAERVIPMEISATVAFTFRRRLAYLTRASKVIVNSCATKETLERHTKVRGDQIVVVPYGLSGAFRSIPASRSVRRAAAGVPEHSPIILQVATAARYKNTKAILHALAILRTHIHDLRLVRIGAPLFADESELARKLDVNGAITYLGVIHDDRMLAEWYNAADVLVFPSLWEGFGWPPLEAMGCGTPVVASNVAAIAEVVGDAGLLVPPDDATALADATERVLTDPALAASLRQMGFERARPYTWASAARRTAAVYDEVLGSHP